MTHTHSRLVRFLAAVGLATTMALVPSSIPAQAAYSGTQRARTSAAARSQLAAALWAVLSGTCQVRATIELPPSFVDLR
jgi:hypothetical protein